MIYLLLGCKNDKCSPGWLDKTLNVSSEHIFLTPRTNGTNQTVAEMRCSIWKKQANTPPSWSREPQGQSRKHMVPRVNALWPRKILACIFTSLSTRFVRCRTFSIASLENRTGHWTISPSLSLFSPSVDRFQGHDSWKFDRQNNMKRSDIRKSGLDREISSRNRCLNPRRENPEK